jgi:hypothetical protein
VGNSNMMESLQGTRLPRALKGRYLKKYYPSVWQDAQVIITGVFVRNHRVVVRCSVVYMFLDHCNSPKIWGHMLTTDFSQPDAARGWRFDRLSLLVPEKFRSSLILSLNPLFHGKHCSKSGKTTPGLYNEPLMAD